MSKTITGLSVPIGTALAVGGVVGEHKVPGNLGPADTLLSVLHVVDGDPVTATDVTAEFTITAGKGGTIENTTTNTSDGFLLVAWAKAE